MTATMLPLTVALSYILVLGKLGSPQFGLSGINLASFITGTLTVVWCFWLAKCAKWSRPFQVFASWHGISWQRCRALIHLGWPISIQVSGELLALTVITYLLGLFGVSALAAGKLLVSLRSSS